MKKVDNKNEAYSSKGNKLQHPKNDACSYKDMPSKVKDKNLKLKNSKQDQGVSMGQPSAASVEKATPKNVKWNTKGSVPKSKNSKPHSEAKSEKLSKKI